MKKAVIQIATQTTAESAFPQTTKLVCKRSAVCILPTSSSRISESSILNGHNLAIFVIPKHFKVKLTSFIKKKKAKNKTPSTVWCHCLGMFQGTKLLRASFSH